MDAQGWGFDDSRRVSVLSFFPCRSPSASLSARRPDLPALMLVSAAAVLDCPSSNSCSKLRWSGELAADGTTLTRRSGELTLDGATLSRSGSDFEALEDEEELDDDTGASIACSMTLASTLPEP